MERWGSASCIVFLVLLVLPTFSNGQVEQWLYSFPPDWHVCMKVDTSNIEFDLCILYSILMSCDISIT